MNSVIDEALLDSLLSPQADPVAAGWQLRQLAESSAGHAIELVSAVSQRDEALGTSDPAIVGAVLRVVHTTLLNPPPGAPDDEAISLAEARVASESVLGTRPRPLDDCPIELINRIHDAVRPSTPNRHLMLHLLAMVRSDESLASLVERLDSAPPQKWIDAAQVLSPLMQHDDWNVAVLYPTVLQSIQHPSLASPLLDVANYLFRKERVATHPASQRVAMLNAILGEVSGRLAQFEENPRAFGDDVESVQTRLGEAVALAVSLCDTVGMIGDEQSIGKLNQTVELKHRRVQCEAAGALARLNEATGRQRLLELVKDPAARLRAIAYADELGFGEQVDDSYRSDQATAESEVSLWLTQPQQMGVPPTSVEVVDSKRMLWPSFTDPVDVFLVRFEYNFGERIYSNIAITGPVTFAMSTDVADFSMADIYAIYAGWHAEHPEIFSVAAEHLNDAQIRIMNAYQKHLDQTGYESISASLLGLFLDEKAGVFMAVRDNKPCVVITDGLETIDYPVAGRMRPVTPGDLFNLYKGRKMLRTFNP